jgi:hypothetical protein
MKKEFGRGARQNGDQIKGWNTRNNRSKKGGNENAPLNEARKPTNEVAAPQN